MTWRMESHYIKSSAFKCTILDVYIEEEAKISIKILITR